MADFADTDVTPIDAALERGGISSKKPKEDVGPVYRVMPDSKIPVSKNLGKLWESRVAQSKAKRTTTEEAWTEAIRYYENDQMEHRNADRSDAAGNEKNNRYVGGADWSETENVVFSNAVTMLPMLYAKNPDCEMTTLEGEKEPYCNSLEMVVDKLLTMKESPGINIKSKARRGVLTAMLTNCAWLELGWTDKLHSSENAIAELTTLSEQYEKAKDKKEIKELEGKIMALEATIDILSPSGPFCKVVSPYRIFFDPTATEPDCTDAQWMAKQDYLPTEFLRAAYGQEKDGQTFLVFEPTHVLKAQVSETHDEQNFRLFTNNDAEASAYGYKNEAAFKAAQFTSVFYVWDKTTRRVLLFADNDWTWPLWVWDDPLKLLRFFPYYRLWFHETTDGAQPKGEVTYYLDQQDAINDINSTISQARHWAKNNIIYDKNRMTESDATDILRGPNGTAKGIDVPEGGKISDVIQSVIPPALNNPELFDIDKRMQAIGRITGIGEAQRGAQFKTNTTNDAVDFYQKNIDIRVDEKIDAIEDWLGDFSWGLAQLVARKWSADDVRKLCGPKVAETWRQVQNPDDFRTTFSLRVVGGSTSKPTSRVKKEEALKMAQVLGQFASGMPALGVVAVKALSRAFNDFVVTQEDWDMILQNMNDTANKAGGGPEGAEGAPPEGAPQGPPGKQTPQPAQVDALKQLIASLPPEAQQRLQELVNSGVAPRDALKEVTEGQQQQPA